MKTVFLEFIQNLTLTDYLLALCWFTVGAATRMFVLHKNLRKGKDITYFDPITVIVAGVYGPLYLILTLLILGSLKMDNVVLLKGKK